MSDYNLRIIEEFRSHGGAVGGTWEGRDLLLLTTTGRKSGRSHTTPMVYTRDGDRLLVYASKGGAPNHPDWYLNLVAHPHVVVEVGSDRFDAIASSRNKWNAGRSSGSTRRRRAGSSRSSLSGASE